MKFIVNHLPTGKQETFRSNKWVFFESHLLDIWNHDMEDECEFIVNGKSVDFNAAQAAAEVARQEWETKRSLTKKQIWVLQGACNLKSNWHTKWVNK